GAPRVRSHRARQDRRQESARVVAAGRGREGRDRAERRQSRASLGRVRHVTGTPPSSNSPTPRRTVSIAAPVGEGAIDSFVRQKGRGVIIALYTALRSVKLYPLEDSAVQKALADLASLTQEFVSTEHELDVRVSGEFIFV